MIRNRLVIKPITGEGVVWVVCEELNEGGSNINNIIGYLNLESAIAFVAGVFFVQGKDNPFDEAIAMGKVAQNELRFVIGEEISKGKVH